MKKWLIFTGVVIVVSVVVVYWSVPDGEVFERTRRLHCNIDGANRRICVDTAWSAWWPWESGYRYRITQRLNREVDWILEKGDWQASGRLILFPVGGRDSIDLRLRCESRAGSNPFVRLGSYRMKEAVSRQMDLVFARLSAFLENPENIYGMDIQPAMSTDSALLVTELKTAAYPSMADIYKTIRELREYAGGQGGKETDPPMLNVVKKRGGYESMIAMPVDRKIKGNERFVYRGFVPWKILTGEIKGGTEAAERALVQLQQYVQDYGRTGMAIPFQSLVTERDQEVDSTRWVTRVIIPVF